jgi:DNA repair and recombination RAD54-like protein
VVEEETGLMVGMLPPLELHKSLEDAMHPHQREGFKFLSRNLVEQPDLGGCMLAFAPGTGKSLLIISFVHSFMCQVPNPRPMIVAPKSMIRPWMQEFKKWQVEETIVLSLYEGPDDAAKLQILKQWQETRNSVLLVSYSQFTNMTGEIETHLIEAPGLMVLDEGHLARTDTTKILKSLSKVHTKRRVLLSGTPFHNNFQEFYTTLEMKRTLKALIGDISLSHETINHDIVTNAFCQLRNLISPFVAWHKGQILNTLPGITDLTVLLELTSQQRELLQKEKSHDSLVRDTLQKRAAAVYFHPIMEPVSDATGKRSQHDPRLKGDDIDVKQGVKLRWVLDLIHLCEAAREKVLVFSEYLYALELIENVAVCRLKYSRGVQILRIDGTMEIGERERAITRFNNDPGAKMMCASIKACGEGISLVGASRVVILEVAWNPSVTRQAISRSFRIGQQKKVVVYRLIAADTHEEHRVHAAATRKEWLSKLLFDPSVSCIDPNSILRDVTNNCSDMFLDHGPLRNGVHSIYEREF